MTQSLKVIPLGGLGEIGKNMMALEYDDDIIVIDAGVLFPEEDMLGVDLVIPNIAYLTENRDRVKGILITHGHEDHTGALPYVLRELNVPVYASRLTQGLIEVKLREHRSLRNVKLEVVEPGALVDLGNFQAEFFRVCHSIPDAMGIAVHTPLGMVVHTGDFRWTILRQTDAPPTSATWRPLRPTVSSFSSQTPPTQRSRAIRHRREWWERRWSAPSLRRRAGSWWPRSHRSYPVCSRS